MPRDTTGRATVTGLTDDELARWRALDPRPNHGDVWRAGLAALESGPVPADERWFALADRFVTALEWTRPARPAPAGEPAAPRPGRARIDALAWHGKLCAAGLAGRERVTRLDVQAALGVGQKRADRVMGLIVAAGLATVHPRIAPLPYTWTLHPPAPGTSPPDAGT
jgi:hypothetical protein